MDLKKSAIDLLIKLNEKNDLYDHNPQEEAEDEINSMTNVQFLELLSKLIGP